MELGFDWNALPDGSKVVDVGGGVGAQSLLIAKANPRLKLIVQDREVTIQEAISVSCVLLRPERYPYMCQFWDQKNPTAIATGQVTFQGIDQTVLYFMTGLIPVLKSIGLLC